MRNVSRFPSVSIPFRWGLLPECSCRIPPPCGQAGCVSIPFRWGLLPEDLRGRLPLRAAQSGLNPLSLGSPSRVVVADHSRAWALYWSQSPFVGVSFQSAVIPGSDKDSFFAGLNPLSLGSPSRVRYPYGGRRDLVFGSQSPFVGVSFQRSLRWTIIAPDVVSLNPLSLGSPSRGSHARQRQRRLLCCVSIPFRWGLLPERDRRGSGRVPNGFCLNPLSLGSPSRGYIVVLTNDDVRDLGLNPLSLGSPSRAGLLCRAVKPGGDAVVSIPFRWGLLPEFCLAVQAFATEFGWSQSPFVGVSFQRRNAMNNIQIHKLLRLNPLSLGSPSRGRSRRGPCEVCRHFDVSIPFRWGLLPESVPNRKGPFRIRRKSQSPFVGVSFQSKHRRDPMRTRYVSMSQSPFVGVSFQSAVRPGTDAVLVVPCLNPLSLGSPSRVP